MSSLTPLTDRELFSNQELDAYSDADGVHHTIDLNQPSNRQYTTTSNTENLQSSRLAPPPQFPSLNLPSFDSGTRRTSKPKPHKSYVSSAPSSPFHITNIDDADIRNSHAGVDEDLQECTICDKMTQTVCTSCAKPVCDKCGYDPDGSLTQHPPSVATLSRLLSFSVKKTTSSSAAQYGSSSNTHQASQQKQLHQKKQQQQNDMYQRLSVASLNDGTSESNEHIALRPTSTGYASVAVMPAQGYAHGLGLSANSPSNTDITNRTSVANPEFWLLLCPNCRALRERRLHEGRLATIKKIATVVLAVGLLATIIGIIFIGR